MRNRYKSTGKASPGMVLQDAEIAVEGLQKSNAAKPESITRILEQWKQQRILTPLDLLQVLRFGISEEEFHCQFDFLSLNRRCMEFLRRLRDRLSEKFPGVRYNDELYQNRNLYSVAAGVFDVVGSLDEERSVEAGASILLQRNQTKKTSLFLQATGEYMAPLIGEEGPKETDRARRICGRMED